MITGTLSDQPTAGDVLKGTAVGIAPIIILLAVQYSIAMRMLADLEAFLLGSDGIGTGFANGVVGNMASMMITAFVVAASVFAATWIGKGFAAGAITGAVAYLSYGVVHVIVNAKIAAFPMIEQIMPVPSALKVLSNGVLLVVIPAFLAAFFASRAVHARAHEARAKVRTYQAAVALEERNREGRAKRAAEDAARAAAKAEAQHAPSAQPVSASEAEPSADAGDEPVADSVTAPAFTPPAPSFLTCTRCGAANEPARGACFECGTVLQPI